jgi:hypothetical protein
VQPDGTLWMAFLDGVARRSPTGEVTVFHRKEVFKCKKIECLEIGPDGRVYVGADNGLFVLDQGDQWTSIGEGLPERGVQHVRAVCNGAVWVRGSKQFSRRNADGSIERFQSRQGVDSAPRTVRLPNDGIWVLPWNANVVYIAPGASRAVPDPICSGAAPGGVRVATPGPDETVWCLAERGFVLRVREGELPRVYVQTDPEKTRWSTVADLCVSPEGNVWLRGNNGDLVSIAAKDLAEADAQPALNREMPGYRRIEPASFGPKETPKSESSTVDLAGKIVVITGTLSKLTRDQAERVLAERGAVLSNTVNKKTNYLIVGIKPSSKLQKAQSLGIAILQEDVLLAPAGSTSTESFASSAKPLSEADIARRFPQADQPVSNTSHLDPGMMRKMAQSKPEITVQEWKSMLEKHKIFLEAGGGNGTWQVLEVSGLLLAALQGYRPDAGEQANLYIKRLPSGFDARHAHLSWLNGCGLLAEGVDFSSANLSKSVLSDAFLAGTKFDGADVSSVDFSRTDLRGASFRNAMVTGADFENCDLTDADFTGTRVDEAHFPGAKLQGVKL